MYHQKHMERREHATLNDSEIITVTKIELSVINYFCDIQIYNANWRHHVIVSHQYSAMVDQTAQRHIHWNAGRWLHLHSCQLLLGVYCCYNALMWKVSSNKKQAVQTSHAPTQTHWLEWFASWFTAITLSCIFRTAVRITGLSINRDRPWSKGSDRTVQY